VFPPDPVAAPRASRDRHPPIVRRLWFTSRGPRNPRRVDACHIPFKSNGQDHLRRFQAGNHSRSGSLDSLTFPAGFAVQRSSPERAGESIRPELSAREKISLDRPDSPSSHWRPALAESKIAQSTQIVLAVTGDGGSHWAVGGRQWEGAPTDPVNRLRHFWVAAIALVQCSDTRSPVLPRSTSRGCAAQVGEQPGLPEDRLTCVNGSRQPRSARIRWRALR
jgi:hypothetical protein